MIAGRRRWTSANHRIARFARFWIRTNRKSGTRCRANAGTGEAITARAKIQARQRMLLHSEQRGRGTKLQVNKKQKRPYGVHSRPSKSQDGRVSLKWWIVGEVGRN